LTWLERHAVALSGALFHDPSPGIAFLIYHRVSGELPTGIDLPFALFERQMRALARSKRVISYERAIDSMREGTGPDRDRVVITFDDGFEDLHRRAFPLLRELRLPFTAFIAAGYVEERVPYVLSKPPAFPVPPLEWTMIRDMLDSGLMTLGAHGYRHRELPGIDEREKEDELLRPLELFHERLGIAPVHYAYPRARWDAASEALVRRHYKTAAVAGFGKVKARSFHPHRIERIPILRGDGRLFFQAKFRGWLAGERAIHERRLGAK
jgi:hypothetical protein